MSKRAEREIKRISIRYNLEQKKDKKVWDVLHDFKEVGYTSRQEFINDALLHYHKWLEAKEAASLPEGLESKFKRWMNEVLSDKVVNIADDRLRADNNPVKAEVENTGITDEEKETFDKSFDFLSSL